MFEGMVVVKVGMPLLYLPIVHCLYYNSHEN